MDDSDVQVINPLDQNISGVEIVEGGGPSTDEQWTALLAAQAEDEGVSQYRCPELTLRFRVDKINTMIDKANEREAVPWAVHDKICPILGTPMEYGYILDSCNEVVGEEYMNTCIAKAEDILSKAIGQADHSEAAHAEMESGLKMLKNPFTNLDISSVFLVKIIE